MEIGTIPGIEEFEEVSERIKDAKEKNEYERRLYKVKDKVFLVENPHTIEVRCDEKLRKLLIEKYESVMESRYFGRGGIEIVSLAHQLDSREIEDLIRLSYNLSREGE